MKQLDASLIIVTGIMYLFGGPFLLGLVEAMTTNNAVLKAQLIPIGFGLFFFCSLVLITGAWLDGFN